MLIMIKVAKESCPNNYISKRIQQINTEGKRQRQTQEVVWYHKGRYVSMWYDRYGIEQSTLEGGTHTVDPI